MTAQVVGLPAPDGRSGAQKDETIRRTVKALMTGRGLNVEVLAPHVGMSAATLYRRLAKKGPGRQFLASEVADLATYFDVTIAELYDGLGGKFVPPPEGEPATATPSQTEGGGDALARLTAQKQARARDADVTRRYPEAA